MREIEGGKPREDKKRGARLIARKLSGWFFGYGSFYMRSDPLPRYVLVLARVLNRNALDAHDIIGATLPVPESTNAWWDRLSRWDMAEW
jgi:hypothetical protein